MHTHVCGQVFFFNIPSDETTTVELRIDEPSEGVPVIGSFNADPFLSRTGRGYFVLAVLDPGKEPTNHFLRDLAAAREPLEKWGRPILLLCRDASALSRLQKEMDENRYGRLPSTVQTGVDTGVVSDSLPLVILADSFNRVFFRSEGYSIGLGEQLAATVARL